MSDYVPTPTQREFMLADKYVRVLAGPVGGGKSVTCVHELVRLACGQVPNAKGVRRTRAVIVRNTADQLALTTRKTVFDWLPPGEAGVWKAVEKTFILKARLPDGTFVESEWLFIALDTPDDVRKALSLEATFLWGNECRELHPDVVDGLLGRLNRYPSPKDGGPTHSCAIFDTNMPDEDTWWHDKMENPPSNWTSFKQPAAIMLREAWMNQFGKEPVSVPNMQTGTMTIDPDSPLIDKDGREWVINPDADNVKILHPDYYPNLVPGKSDDWLRVYLRSEYGRSLSGTPVYEKTFVPDFHVAKEALRPLKGEAHPIVIGVDFGRTPAAVFKQRDARGRVLTLGEVTSENMGVETFIRTKLNPFIASRFQGHTFYCAPDPAGFAKTQLNEMTLVDALKNAGFKCVKPPSNSPELRIQAVERLLNAQVEGKAMYLVDPSCTTLIQGFRYGYRYKIKKNGELEDRPDKNAFSHCVAEGTSVLARRGLVPIEQLCVGDEVWTRQGWKPVTATMWRYAETIEAAGLVCTPDHPFITGRGRVRADALQYDVLFSVKETKWAAPLSTLHRISTAFASTANRRATTSPTTGPTCTAACGSSIAGLFRRTITSTTGTVIGGITQSPTWNALRLQSMQATTGATPSGGKHFGVTCWKTFNRWQPNGIEAKKVALGTESTASKHGRGGSQASAPALNVDGSTKAGGPRSAASVAKRASNALAAALARMTWRSSAMLAATPVASTSTPKRCGVRRVYDLTIADAHEFVANGVLVGNCHDANQYADSVIDMSIRGVALGGGRREVRRVDHVY